MEVSEASVILMVTIASTTDVGGTGSCGEDSSFMFETCVHKGARMVAY